MTSLATLPRILGIAIMISLLSPTVANAQVPHYMFQWGVFGSSNGQFFFPHGVALDLDGNVYVVDSMNHRIQKFTSDGRYLLQWGALGTAPGQFNEPWWLALDAQGDVYVTDMKNHRVQKFSSEGGFITQWGSEGTANGQFQFPVGIGVDPEGSVFVSDAGNNRIQKFSSTGAYLSQWAFGHDRWDQPRELAVDGEGHVWVPDPAHYCMRKFSSTGVLLVSWSGGQGVYSAQGVTADALGNIYLTDGTGAVEKHDPAGDLLARWGSYGNRAGELNSPSGIAVSPAGEVYVVDGNRVQVFGAGAVSSLRTTWSRVKQSYR